MSSYLCEDLIAEIFERLPAKSLVRFRCLSKSWYSCIGSPYLKHKHYLRSKQKVLIRHWETCSPDAKVRHLKAQRRNDEIKDLYALHSDDHQFPLFDTLTKQSFPFHLSKVVNSFNGILCLFDSHENRITLWNPSIGRVFTIPEHPSFTDPHDRNGNGNGERLSVVAVGFGFDPVTDDYKIVRISYGKYEPSVERSSYVYSIKTRAWSPIASPLTPFLFLKLKVCFVNGVVHWVAQLPQEQVTLCIVTFNLSSHVFGKIKLPEHTWFTRKPTIIDGCLAVVCYDYVEYCWIWVMREYNNVASWYPLFKMKYTHDDGIKSVMQLSTSGYLLIGKFLGFEVYNQVTGVSVVLSKLTGFNKYYMETCHESLELLDTGHSLSLSLN